MQIFTYAYILESQTFPGRHYSGLTSNLEQRLSLHNSGKVPHSSKYRPWRYKIVIAFRDHAKALAFEKYLKSHSGRFSSSPFFEQKSKEEFKSAQLFVYAVPISVVLNSHQFTPNTLWTIRNTPLILIRIS